MEMLITQPLHYKEGNANEICIRHPNGNISGAYFQVYVDVWYVRIVSCKEQNIN